MKLFYCDQFTLPLPPGHRFPMAKYARLRERLALNPLFAEDRFVVPEPASDAVLGRVHSARYLEQMKTGALPPELARRIGFPWSPAMVERSRRSVGGTLGAADAALADGVGVNLAGGTHHAFADRGGGFCVFNDVVVAATALLDRALVDQVLVVDLDVHQGDGTAALCADEPRIFTFSIHGEKNYPARKQVSDLDLALPDGTGDEEYLAALSDHLPVLIERVRPDFAFYLAGADPYRGDRLGRLALSKEGLARRDRFVFETLEEASVPVALVMAGGYAEEVDDIVDIHEQTVVLAKRAAYPVRSESARSERPGAIGF